MLGIIESSGVIQYNAICGVDRRRVKRQLLNVLVSWMAEKDKDDRP
jgi:hypothetical protein